MKVIIFGTGKVYQNSKEWIPKEDIVAFVDNAVEKQGSLLDGVRINPPEDIQNIIYDRIVLMSAQEQRMKEQLLEMGVPSDVIWSRQKYKTECSRGVLKMYCYYETAYIPKGRILIIAQNLRYDGSTMAAVYAVNALQERGYQAILAAPSGDQMFIEEMSQRRGINIVICPTLRDLDTPENLWIKQFDIVIVNVFPMISCACAISKYKPVLWWLHEVGIAYEQFLEAYPQYMQIDQTDNMHIMAVSQNAKNNFEAYYPGRVQYIMPYGIPDEYVPTADKTDGAGVTFAIVGNICERKAQKDFVQAAAGLTQEELEQSKFLVIGSDDKDAYYNEIKRLATGIPQIKFLGQLSREKMKEIYQSIDVVICASVEECLPVVVVEAMMHKKVSVVSDSAGMMEYIRQENNGILYQAGNVEELRKRMEWCLEHRYELRRMGEKARKVYEDYFTIDSFGKRLEALIIKIKKNVPKKTGAYTMEEK